MVQRLILVLALVAISLQGILANNWCDLESCNGAEHIDCIIAAGEFGPACPAERNMLNLVPVQKAILDEHNKLRNQIAGGDLANYEPAARMGSLVWNVTLANLARKNVRQCAMRHDGCRNTPEINYAGQNLAMYSISVGASFNNLEIILGRINAWWSEHKDGKMAYINAYPEATDNGEVVGHFTQIARDYVTRVGCAAIVYTDTTWKSLLFACNYDMTNVITYPIYDVGPTASQCTTGTHPDYPNLCGPNEVYNINLQ